MPPTTHSTAHLSHVYLILHEIIIDRYREVGLGAGGISAIVIQERTDQEAVLRATKL